MFILKLVVIFGFCSFLIIAKRRKVENQKYSCQSTDIASNEVTFAEFQCGKSKTGEYTHEIEFEDGSFHREIGLIVNGVFSIRGFL